MLLMRITISICVAVLLGPIHVYSDEFEPPDVIREPYTKPRLIPRPPPPPDRPEITPPRQLGNAPLSKPEYPSESLSRGEQGNLKLWLFVDVEGRPVDLKLRRSSGFERLDEPAIQEAWNWRFQPGTLDGKAVAQWISVEVRFVHSVGDESEVTVEPPSAR